MRRKIVSATPKMLVQSGLKCGMCTDWEGISGQSDERSQRAKARCMRRTMKSWGECAKLVYVDNKALAYAQYAPAEFWPGAGCFVSGPVSDDAVLLACLYVLPQGRGGGLGKMLLQSVEAGLVKRKVRAIEVFAAKSDTYPPGPIDFYLKNGFFIFRDDPHFPLLRLELKALVGWQVNIQFTFDGLRIPTRGRTTAPALPTA